MGIDGIGKPPGAGVPKPGSGGVAGNSGESFSVDKAAAPEAAGVSQPLAELESGRISLDQYLDGRVDEATSHLAGRLPAEQLEFVRTTLREQLATDPVLVELVRRATGAIPSEPSG